jgi:hypothetical protein
MKVLLLLLLLLPLEREREERRERERERYSQRDASQTEEFPHLVLAMEINDKKMKNR